MIYRQILLQRSPQDHAKFFIISEFRYNRSSISYISTWLVENWDLLLTSLLVTSLYRDLPVQRGQVWKMRINFLLKDISAAAGTSAANLLIHTRVLVNFSDSRLFMIYRRLLKLQKKNLCARSAHHHVREAHITSAKREVPCGRGPGPAQGPAQGPWKL